MGKVIEKTGVKREKGYLYFLDKKGNVARVQMARAGKKTSRKQEVVSKVGIERKTGFLYYIDKQGHVAEAKMARGGKKKKRWKNMAKKKSLKCPGKTKAGKKCKNFASGKSKFCNSHKKK